jgi:hypothetical protein
VQFKQLTGHATHELLVGCDTVNKELQEVQILYAEQVLHCVIYDEQGLHLYKETAGLT